jgi:DNA-binding MarR family transcriptional regulator
MSPKNIDTSSLKASGFNEGVETVLAVMASERLSRLQRRILVWLLAEAQRTRGTMAADLRDLVRALGHDKGNLSTSLKGLEAKGLVTIAWTPDGRAEAVELTAEGRNQAARLTASYE